MRQQPYSHLLTKINITDRCSVIAGDHYYLPTGTVRAMVGDNVSVDFYCKYCDKRITEFLTKAQYNTYKKQLKQE